MPYILHFTPYTLRSALYTLHFALYALHFTPYTLHFTLHTQAKWDLEVVGSYQATYKCKSSVLAYNWEWD